MALPRLSGARAAILLLVYGDYYRLILAMVLVGMLNILVGSSVSALSAELIPQENRGKTNGSRGFFSTLALSLGQLSGGYLYDNVSHQLPFLLELVFIVPVIYMTWFWLKEPKPVEP